MSENVTVDGAFGPGGGGVLGKLSELYERPGRGVGVGVCALTPAIEMTRKIVTSTVLTHDW